MRRLSAVRNDSEKFVSRKAWYLVFKPLVSGYSGSL